MTPYEIDILLWYHTRGNDHPNLHEPPPIWRETIDKFMKHGMLRQGTATECMVYAATDKLHFYVKALCSVPLPKPSFTIDWPRSHSEEQS